METSPAARLLLVDQDAAYSVRLGKALALAGHAVDVCSGLDDSLAAARRARITLAIIDPDAGGGLGLELARQLRDAQGVPFICLFAESGSEEAGRAAALGAIGFLAKPSDPALCLPTVTVALALALARAAERLAAHESIAGLERALGESRAIGFAVGLLMERLRMDRTQAFAALREEARARRQRIGDVAESLLAAAELINGLQGEEPTAAQLLAS
jgi:response regulator NasT